jgi:hypothetical protein
MKLLLGIGISVIGESLFYFRKKQYIVKLQNHAVCYSLFLTTEKAKVPLFLIQHHAMKT